MTDFSHQDPDHSEGPNPWPLFPERTLKEIPETAILPDSGFIPAGFFRRVFAYLFDLATIEWLSFLFVGIGFLARDAALGPAVTVGFREPFAEWTDLHLRAWSFLFISYFTFFTFYGGQSPGKLALGIRVTMKDGSPVPVLNAFLRVLGYFLDVLTLGVGFLAAWISPSRRTLHDYLAGTIVSKSPKT